ncbi:MAG: hypothetical protein MJ252_31025, partial [archaeon]|nr:hypothetical protein [archaeon]
TNKKQNKAQDPKTDFQEQIINEYDLKVVDAYNYESNTKLNRVKSIPKSRNKNYENKLTFNVDEDNHKNPSKTINLGTKKAQNLNGNKTGENMMKREMTEENTMKDAFKKTIPKNNNSVLDKRIKFTILKSNPINKLTRNNKPLLPSQNSQGAYNSQLNTKVDNKVETHKATNFKKKSITMNENVNKENSLNKNKVKLSFIKIGNSNKNEEGNYEGIKTNPSLGMKYKLIGYQHLLKKEKSPDMTLAKDKPTMVIGKNTAPKERSRNIKNNQTTDKGSQIKSKENTTGFSLYNKYAAFTTEKSINSKNANKSNTNYSIYDILKRHRNTFKLVSSAKNKKEKGRIIQSPTFYLNESHKSKIQRNVSAYSFKNKKQPITHIKGKSTVSGNSKVGIPTSSNFTTNATTNNNGSVSRSRNTNQVFLISNYSSNKGHENSGSYLKKSLLTHTTLKNSYCIKTQINKKPNKNSKQLSDFTKLTGLENLIFKKKKSILDMNLVKLNKKK